MLTTYLLLAVAWLLLATGIYLVLTGWHRRPSLAERLKPYHVRSLADEAQEWLQDRHRA